MKPEPILMLLCPECGWSTCVTDPEVQGHCNGNAWSWAPPFSRENPDVRLYQGASSTYHPTKLMLRYTAVLR